LEVSLSGTKVKKGDTTKNGLKTWVLEPVDLD
jgi:hypothetical protein